MTEDHVTEEDKRGRRGLERGVDTERSLSLWIQIQIEFYLLYILFSVFFSLSSNSTALARVPASPVGLQLGTVALVITE